MNAAIYFTVVIPHGDPSLQYGGGIGTANLFVFLNFDPNGHVCFQAKIDIVIMSNSITTIHLPCHAVDCGVNMADLAVYVCSFSEFNLRMVFCPDLSMIYIQYV